MGAIKAVTNLNNYNQLKKWQSQDQPSATGESELALVVTSTAIFWLTPESILRTRDIQAPKNGKQTSRASVSTSPTSPTSSTATLS